MDNISGHLVLLMGPTGSGKGTIVKHVQEAFPELRFAVSCTTRAMRPGEVHGVDYYYLTTNEFNEKIRAGTYLEWAEFSGNKYGTLRSEIIGRLEDGEVVLNEIELQGIHQLLPIIPAENRTLVYVEAGSWEDLKDRALARAPISAEHLALREERYYEEVKMKPYADVVIENMHGEIKEAKEQMATVIKEVFARITV